MSESAAADDERFDEIVADYLDAIADGKQPDESRVLAAHPEFADDLKKFFADHRRMGGLLDVASEDTTAPSGKTRGLTDAVTFRGLDEPENYGVDPEKCIADYLLLEKIAEGGMGVVFQARQLSLNRIVALKMIRAGEFADPEEIRRFRIEAEAAAKLSHPGIVPIYQIGEDKGQHFFSMGLVEGPSLSDLIRKERMKPRRAARYVAKVARAVHYAHEQGIIHRDIKPANVLVDKNDEPLVTDFGLAKQITGDHELTMSGQILGTASYMPPEQAAGQEITPLADVYSLGALLYALLTKQPPFTGANPVDILMDVLSKDPATPSSLNITLSRDLETICMRCLDKDPKRRYASAAALADDLERFLDGAPILARPVGRVEKYLRWCRRKPAVAATILLSALLFGVVPLAYVTYQSDSIRYISAFRPRTQSDKLLLANLAWDQYQNRPPDVQDVREEAWVAAGLAMLTYQRGQIESSAVDALTQFEKATDAIRAALVEWPSDPGLKFALADCQFELARFRFPRDGMGTVSEKYAADVQQNLTDAITLLEQLRENAQEPEQSRIGARLTAVQLAMEKLPGGIAERLQRMEAARAYGTEIDRANGVIRFEILGSMAIRSKSNPRPQPPDQVLEDPSDQSQYFRLANASFYDKELDQALEAYRNAFERAGESDAIPSALLRQAFSDLAIMARSRPEVKFVLAGRWPRSAYGFYTACLGIRQADMGIARRSDLPAN